MPIPTLDRSAPREGASATSRVVWWHCRALLPALLLATACDLSPTSETNGDADAGPDGSGDSGDPNTVEGFLARWRREVCDYYFRCPRPNDDWLGSLAILQTRERCVEVYERMGFPFEVVSSVQLKTVTFHPELAEELFAKLDTCTPTGNNFVKDLRLLVPVLQGTVAEGAACYASFECAGDAYCEREPDACPGACRQRAAIGAAVRACDSAACSSNECRLDPASLDGVCVDVRLSGSAPEGAACGETQEDPTHFVHTQCADGLWCDPVSSSCRQPIAPGAACSSYDEICADADYCYPDANGAHHCVRVVLGETGGSCSETASATELRMCDWLYLAQCVGGTCQTTPEGLEGDPCVRGDAIGSTCGSGLYCATGNVCAQKRQAGEACEGNDASCVSETCDGATGTCAARRCYLY